jgi:hypothetical protein
VHECLPRVCPAKEDESDARDSDCEPVTDLTFLELNFVDCPLVRSLLGILTSTLPPLAKNLFYFRSDTVRPLLLVDYKPSRQST